MPFAALLLAACGQGGSELTAAEQAEIAARSAPVAVQFQQRLKTRLGEALASGGPKTAVSVCKEAAPAIAAMMSEESGAEVRRISAFHRNPDGGVPGSMRRQYNALASDPVVDGKPATRIWRDDAGPAPRIHYLSAIPMQDQPCSTCHGTDIDPELQAHIDELYPDDLATGFQPGQLRGALVVSWPVEGS